MSYFDALRPFLVVTVVQEEPEEIDDEPFRDLIEAESKGRKGDAVGQTVGIIGVASGVLEVEITLEEELDPDLGTSLDLNRLQD